jgi:putative flippase GtrA
VSGGATVRRLLADRRVRYVIAGGLSAAIYYAAFTGLWLAGREQIPYLAVAVLANLFTAVVIYPVNRLVVFRAAGSWLAGFLRFYVLSLWALLVNLGGLSLLVEVGRLNVLVAQAIVIVVSSVINYQISRVWVFRCRRAAEVPPAGAGPASHRFARLHDKGTRHDVGLGVARQDEVEHLQR